MPVRPARARLLTMTVLAALTATTAVTTTTAATAAESSRPNQSGQPSQSGHLGQPDTPDRSPAAAQVAAPVPQLDWAPCETTPDGPDLDDFRCATAEVPTDYDDPTGDTTTIALTKLPATNPDARIGTLFTNPGGPGGSGVAFVQQSGKTAYTADVRAHFDILGFDPRAVGASDPATCYRTAATEERRLADNLAFPVTDAQELRYYGENLRMAINCRITSPERIEHSSTANVARDMDLLRQAVGDSRLTYMGYSYGSFLGATYAKLFPGNIRALAIDGTIVPQNYAGHPDEEELPTGERLGQGPAASETFGEFLRLCAEAGPDRCSLAGLGDPETVVEDLFARLKADPAEVELPDGGTMEVTYQTAVVQAFFAMYTPAQWTSLDSFLTQLAAGRATLNEKAAAVFEHQPPQVPDQPPQLPQRPRRGEDYNSVGSALASVCVETGTTGDPRGYADRADAVDAEAPHFGRLRTWISLPCEYLNLTDDDAYLGPWEQEVDSPVLVIGTRFDPGTPYAGTRPYADNFPDARVLTVEGWGHTVLGKSSCADQVISEYLVDLTAPDDGSTCDQDTPPFS